MTYTRVIGIALIGALAVAPALARADEGQRQRSGSDGRRERAQGSSRGESGQGGQRAVPRGRESQPQRDQGGRREDEPRGRQPERSRDEGSREYAVPRSSGGQRYEGPRNEGPRNEGPRYEGPRYEGPRYDNRQHGGGRYESQRQYQARRYEPRAIQRPYYSRGGYGPRTIIVPRYIRPSIVTIAPYRPYVYRPRFGLGVYYGEGGSYPYGYTPRGYYDPLPGRIYGGLRITDAPREAQVFADGYYLGIVDDFDGMFQHANLEAGTHRIEIQAPGFESVAFDVFVQPGRTITFRAEMYPY